MQPVWGTHSERRALNISSGERIPPFSLIRKDIEAQLSRAGNQTLPSDPEWLASDRTGSRPGTIDRYNLPPPPRREHTQAFIDFQFMDFMVCMLPLGEERCHVVTQCEALGEVRCYCHFISKKPGTR